MYDVQGQVPCVKYVHLRQEPGGPPTPVALEEAMPLQQLLAPVAACKEQIAAAVDALQPDEITTQGNTAADPLGPRSFGAALQAVLGYPPCLHSALHCLAVVKHRCCVHILPML